MKAEKYCYYNIYREGTSYIQYSNNGCGKFTNIEWYRFQSLKWEPAKKKIMYTCIPYVLKESNLVEEFLQGIGYRKGI